MLESVGGYCVALDIASAANLRTAPCSSSRIAVDSGVRIYSSCRLLAAAPSSPVSRSHRAPRPRAYIDRIFSALDRVHTSSIASLCPAVAPDSPAAPSSTLSPTHRRACNHAGSLGGVSRFCVVFYVAALGRTQALPHTVACDLAHSGTTAISNRRREEPGPRTLSSQLTS